MIELKTENLILRTVTEADLEEVARMWNFEKGKITLEEAEKAVSWMKKNHNSNKSGKITHLCLAVFESSEPGKIIGWCGLDGRSTEKGVNIFYLIDKNFRNKGYGSECARKILECGFRQMKLPEIKGGCKKTNFPSQKILEKIGMKMVSEQVAGDDNSSYYRLTAEEYRTRSET